MRETVLRRRVNQAEEELRGIVPPRAARVDRLMAIARIRGPVPREIVRRKAARAGRLVRPVKDLKIDRLMVTVPVRAGRTDRMATVRVSREARDLLTVVRAGRTDPLMATVQVSREAKDPLIVVRAGRTDRPMATVQVSREARDPLTVVRADRTDPLMVGRADRLTKAEVLVRPEGVLPGRRLFPSRRNRLHSPNPPRRPTKPKGIAGRTMKKTASGPTAI